LSSGVAGSQSARCHALAGRLNGVPLGLGRKSASALRPLHGAGHNGVAELSGADLPGADAHGIDFADAAWPHDLIGADAHGAGSETTNLPLKERLLWVHHAGKSHELVANGVDPAGSSHRLADNGVGIGANPLGVVGGRGADLAGHVLQAAGLRTGGVGLLQGLLRIGA
jgi:hypothetical protein